MHETTNRLVAALALVVVPVTAAANSPHEHKGFYLRMHIGPAYFHGTSGDADVTIKGPAGTFGFAIGGALTKNFILYAEAFDDIAIRPTVEIGNNSYDTDGSSGMVGYGVGVAYYFMPVNVYVAGAVDGTTIVVHDPSSDRRARTDFGIGTNLMVGKEWWVSPNWGLGVAGQFAFGGRMKDDLDQPYNAVAFGVVFSATYN